MDELQILVKAIVDESSEQSMNTELGKLTKALRESHKIELEVALEDGSVKTVQNQLQAIAKQVKTTSSAAGKKSNSIKIFDSTQLKADGQKYFNGVKDIVSRAQAEFSKMGKVDITNVFKDAKGNVQSFTASVTKADGIVEKFNFELAKIKNGTRNLTGFVQSNSILSDKNAGTGLEKTLNYLNRINTQIADITSKTLVNTSKPLLSDMEQFNQYQTKLTTVKTRIEEIKKANTTLSAEHKREIDSMVADLKRYAQELQTSAYVSVDLKAATMPAKKEELQATLQTNIQKWTNAGLFGGEFKTKVLEAKRLLDEATDPSDLDEYRHHLKLLAEDYRQLGLLSQWKDKSVTNNTLATNILTAQTRIENLKQTYSKFLQDPNLSQKWQALFESSQIVTSQKELTNLNARIRLFEQELIKADKHSKSFLGNLQANAAKMGEWMLLGGALAGIMRGISGIGDAVVELNTAMTELKKVTNETDEAYDAFLSSAADKAVEIGTSYSDFVTATSSFARLGYNINDASHLAEVANIYSVVGDEINGIEDATSSIISTMKAFNIEASDAMSIVDKFNEVGNNFAISSGGIGDAMQRSAAAMYAANNTIDESIALIVAANNVIQDPDMVGTMWKTVSMRIRGAVTELQEAGLETEYMAESTASLQKKIKALTNVDGLGGFDIMADPETFKSTYDIILGISEVWEKMSDIDQSALLELLAGKRQGNALAAAIMNMGDAVKVLESSVGAEGSALEEHEKWMDSIIAKQQQFQAQYESMSNAILSSGLIAELYGIGTGLLSVITALAKLNLLLPTIVAGYTTIKSIKAWQSAAQTSAAISSLVTRLISEKTATDALVASYQSLTFKQQQDVANKLKQAVVSGQLTAAEYSEISAKLGLTTATLGTAAATDTLNFSIKALLASNPIGWIISAISLLPTLVGWIKSLHKSNDELIQDANELKNAYQMESTNITTDLSTLRGLREEFAELSKGVDDYGENISLAADDYERYQEIVNTILGISPSLIAGYNDEGSAIANKNNLLERSIALMEEEQRIKVKEHLEDDNLRTIAGGVIAGFEEELSSIEIPVSLKYSGVQIKDNGKTKSGSINQIESYVERAIGVEFDIWNDSIPKYIARNAKLVEQNIGEILTNASTDFVDKNGVRWKGLAESQIEDLKEYILSITGAVKGASSELNTELQMVPQMLTAYADLTNGQREFISNYINNFSITASTTEDDILQMKQDILDFTEFVAGNSDLKSVITVGIALQNGKDNDGKTLTISDYEASVKEFIASLDNLDEETQVHVKAVFGVDENSFSESDIQLALNHMRNILMDEYDELIGEFSVQDAVSIYYNVTAKPNSMTLEDLRDALDQIRKVPSPQDTVNKFKSIVNVLRVASNEYKNMGAVSTDTYKDVIALGEDYADLFDFTNGKIELESGTLGEFIDKLIQEYGAILAANGATEDQIQALYAYGASLKSASGDTEVTTSSLKSLVDILSSVQEGTSYSSLAMLDLLEQYPELAGHIIETADGYTIEESAVKSLIVEKANLYKINESLAKQAARDKLDDATNNNGKSSATVDAIFEEYGDSISSFEDYVTAWEKYFNESAAGVNWVDGLEEYVNATIAEVNRLEDINKLLEDLLSPDQYKFGTTTKSRDDDIESEFEIQYKEHQHLLAMEQESVEDYLAWLSSSIDNALKTEQIKQDDYYKYQEEIYDKTKDLFDDYLNDNEHSIFLLESADAEASEIVKIYSGMMSAIEAQIQTYMNLGLDANSDYIQELQKQWYSYKDNVEDIYRQTYSDKIGDYEHDITILEQDSGSSEEIVSKYRQMQAETQMELDRARASGLDENDDYIQDLIKQWLDYEEAIEDINQQVFSDKIGDYEHDIFLLEKAGADSQEIIDIYRKMQDETHAEAERYRALGEDENADYIQDLQKQWWDYQQYIEDLLHGIYQSTVAEHENTISYLESQYDALDSHRSSDEMSANLNKQLEAQRAIQRAAEEEANRLRATGLDENDEAVKECIDAWWNAENAIRNINSRIAENTLSVFDDFIKYADDFELWGDLDITKVDYLKQKIAAINKLFEEGILSLKEYNTLLRETQLEIYNEQKEALTEIIEMTMELVRQEAEDHVDALEDQIDKYRKIIELKKEALSTSKEEDDYDKEVAKKVGKIADIQAKIAQLDRDDSREANAEKQQLAQELAELQEDLADYQADYAYNAQVDALDKEAETFEDTKNKEIAKVEAAVDTEEEVYNAAIARIDSNWEQLYADLIAWNKQYGDMIDGEDSITSAWQTAKAAAEEYGSVVAALNGISSSAAYEEEQLRNQQYTEQAIHKIIKEMYANSQAHHTADASGKERLDKRNLELGAMLAQYGITAVRGGDGVWYIDRIGGEKLYDKYKQYTYHTGGIVGEEPNLKHNEVLAKLEKGEVVLTQKEFNGLFEKVKSGIRGIIDSLVGGLTVSEPAVSEVVKTITNNNGDTDNSITEEGIQIHNEFHMENVTEENMKQFADYYAEHTIDRLMSAAKRKGMKNTVGSHMLR